MVLFISVVIALLTETFQEISQEYTVKKYDYKIHMVIKFLMIAVMTFIWQIAEMLYNKRAIDSIFKITMNAENLLYLFAILALSIYITILFNKLLKISSIYILNVVLKLSIVVVFIIEYIRGELIISKPLIVGLACLIFGLLVVLRYNKKEESIPENKTLNVYIVYSMMMILAITVGMPYLEQYILRQSYISQELLIIVESLAISLYALVILKPTNKIDKVLINDYFLQSLLCTIAGIAFKYIITESMATYTITLAITMISVMVFSTIILKTKIVKQQYVGVILAVVGYFILSIK